MTDIAVVQVANGGFDIALSAGDVVRDQGLETAVLLSLHLDARHDGQRGWWADAVDDNNTVTGSKLWTIGRSKTTQAPRLAAQALAQQALAWLVAEGVAKRVDVNSDAVPGRGDALLLQIDITRPDNSRYSTVWPQAAEQEE